MGLMGVISSILMTVTLATAPPGPLSVPPVRALTPSAARAAEPPIRHAPAAAQPADATPAAAAFASARFVPADVTTFVHIENAARTRRNLAARPLSHWLMSLASDGAVVKSWGGLAQQLQTSDAALFDNCFGRSVTFASRAPGQWVIVTDIDEIRTRDLLRRLEVRVREPQFGLAISELPEQALLLASDGGRLIIGPAAQAQLFSEVLQRISAGDNAAAAARPATLADDTDLRQRAAELQCDLPRVSIAAFIRHERPLGGCSMIVADVRGDQLRLTQSARFDNPPFSSPVSKLSCDFSPLNLFADRALVAIMQPRDVGDGPVESFLTASLGAGLVSPDMRRNLADRRLLVMGEQDARQVPKPSVKPPKPSDILTTTFVACLELKDAGANGGPDDGAAAAQLDQQMARITRSLNDLGKGAFLIRMPDCAALRAADPRHVDLGAAGEWFTGGFPVMKTVSLDWQVAEGPQGTWFVVGSNPQALKDTVDALRKPCPHDARLAGRFDNCGSANGVRLAHHVESWSDEAQEFTDPPHVEQVRSTLRMMADLANGLQTCRWQMARPTANTMRLDVQITLTPAETAGK